MRDSAWHHLYECFHEFPGFYPVQVVATVRGLAAAHATKLHCVTMGLFPLFPPKENKAPASSTAATTPVLFPIGTEAPPQISEALRRISSCGRLPMAKYPGLGTH